MHFIASSLRTEIAYCKVQSSKFAQYVTKYQFAAVQHIRSILFISFSFNLLRIQTRNGIELASMNFSDANLVDILSGIISLVYYCTFLSYTIAHCAVHAHLSQISVFYQISYFMEYMASSFNVFGTCMIVQMTKKRGVWFSNENKIDCAC